MSDPADAGRSGLVALAGRPNVGKSALLNALVGRKLSIVTPRPQTTRYRTSGVTQWGGAQVALVDTPGLHRAPRRALNLAMNRTAAAALAQADLVLFVTEALSWRDEDALALGRVRKAARPVIAVVNKIDRVRPRTRLLPFLAQLSERGLSEIVPVSALSGENLEQLRGLVAARLPHGEPHHAPGELSERGVPFVIAETIREKLTLELVEELPYGVAVEVERIETQPDGVQAVSALIWVERPSHKPIVIGARGERLKRIGRAARLELNQRLGGRFHLTLWVKVREGWADDARALRELGLE